MNIMAELIIGGWMSTIGMFGFFALSESGKPAAIGRQLASVLEFVVSVLRVPEEILQLRLRS
jgi:hypothetical protein